MSDTKGLMDVLNQLSNVGKEMQKVKAPACIACTYCTVIRRLTDNIPATHCTQHGPKVAVEVGSFTFCDNYTRKEPEA